MTTREYTVIDLSGTDDNTCEICYDESNKNIVLFHCNHNLCLKCYHGMLDEKYDSCPFCREHIIEMEENINPELEQLLNENQSLRMKLQIVIISYKKIKKQFYHYKVFVSAFICAILLTMIIFM